MWQFIFKIIFTVSDRKIMTLINIQTIFQNFPLPILKNCFYQIVFLDEKSCNNYQACVVTNKPSVVENFNSSAQLTKNDIIL